MWLCKINKIDIFKKGFYREREGVSIYRGSL